MSSKRIIVALDSSNFDKVKKLAETLKKEVYAFKIGYQFFFNFGIKGYKKFIQFAQIYFLI